MHEEIKRAPEEIAPASEVLSSEQREQAEYWLKITEQENAAKPSEQLDEEKTRAELNEIFEVWLTSERLEPLRALTTQAEAVANPLRREAKEALERIVERINKLDRPPELLEKYKKLSRAVGIMSGGVVDHTR